MVSAEPAERTVESRRIEAPDLDAGLPERSPESARSVPKTAEPVVEKADAHAVASLGRQHLGEPPPGGILVNDVALEVDRLCGRTDRLQPGGVVLCGVAEQANRVAGHERRAASSRERLLGEDAAERDCFSGGARVLLSTRGHGRDGGGSRHGFVSIYVLSNNFLIVTGGSSEYKVSGGSECANGHSTCSSQPMRHRKLAWP